ncbi:MAG: tetratricopeptide repeat protein [Longimicrobiales bacterium]|nr:tetratricopeptide repeat protein [Longimicrobiales bacterium]
MDTLIPSRYARLGIVFGALFVTTACATKNDLRDLQLELRRELRAVQARQDSLLAEIRSTQATSRATRDATEREFMDTRGSLLTELRTISTQMQRIEELSGQNQIAIQSLSQRVDGLSRGQAAGSSGGRQPPRDGLLAPGVRGDPEADYEAAIDLYRGGQLFGARAAFEDFLSAHPQHEFVPLVHFYIGDIAYEEGRLDDAIASFERVGELFPESPRVADALYRIGVIHLERDEDDEARRVFESIVNTWGDSDDVFYAGVVQNARDRLRELGG